MKPPALIRQLRDQARDLILSGASEVGPDDAEWAAVAWLICVVEVLSWVVETNPELDLEETLRRASREQWIRLGERR